MEITEIQKNKITEWVNEGASLAEVQRRLSEELEISMTYMEVRFMIIDLGLTLQDHKESAPSGPAVLDKTGAVQQDISDDSEDVADPMSTSNVSVEIDRVVKPGSLVSGSVVFSNGEKASWSLDQLGRLALDSGGSEVRPPPEDIKAFQDELRRKLEKRGF